MHIASVDWDRLFADRTITVPIEHEWISRMVARTGAMPWLSVVR